MQKNGWTIQLEKLNNNITTMSQSEKCVGCGLCSVVCPRKCIQMTENEEGFLYPVLRQEDCINCGLCKNKCPIINKKNHQVKEVYAACAINKKMLKTCNSGGVFSVLAQEIIENRKGIVCGAAYDENLRVKHICIEKEEELWRLQGSKYVQSEIYETFQIVQSALECNRFVLFSGTGCQIAALNSYLRHDYDNLLTVEVVCHGVPSPGLFRKYIDWISKKKGEKVIAYSFRTKVKRNTGEHCQFMYKTDSKVYFEYYYKDPYYAAFMSGRTLRECCYNCQFKGEARVGDITIGDFWGIEKVDKKFPVHNGVSLVMVNTDKAISVIESVREKLYITASTYEYAIAKNPSIYKTTVRPACKVNLKNENLFESELKPKKNIKNIIKSRIPWRAKIFIKKWATWVDSK